MNNRIKYFFVLSGERLVRGKRGEGKKRKEMKLSKRQNMRKYFFVLSGVV